jgi:hypothetical protein
MVIILNVDRKIMALAAGGVSDMNEGVILDDGLPG